MSLFENHNQDNIPFSVSHSPIFIGEGISDNSKKRTIKERVLSQPVLTVYDTSKSNKLVVGSFHLQKREVGDRSSP